MYTLKLKIQKKIVVLKDIPVLTGDELGIKNKECRSCNNNKLYVPAGYIDTLENITDTSYAITKIDGEEYIELDEIKDSLQMLEDRYKYYINLYSDDTISILKEPLKTQNTRRAAPTKKNLKKIKSPCREKTDEHIEKVDNKDIKELDSDTGEDVKDKILISQTDINDDLDIDIKGIVFLTLMLIPVGLMLLLASTRLEPIEVFMLGMPLVTIIGYTLYLAVTHSAK